MIAVRRPPSFHVLFIFSDSNGVSNFDLATALIITFVVEDHVDEDTCKDKDTMLWEAEFIKYLKSYQGENITVSFIAEVRVGTCNYQYTCSQ